MENVNYCYVKFHYDFVLQGDENFRWWMLFPDGYRVPITDSLAVTFIQHSNVFNMEHMIEDYTCDEILQELLTRFRETNGIEFCNKENLASLAAYILLREDIQESVE